ncbi:MAG: hypothetical protein K2X39_06435, partial [Silvanigrellaceae bacterium]|nr:hypothetical protein [Silvanigrellaceae bacterium]
DIGERSYLLAKKGIQADSVSRESLLLSTTGDLKVANTDYGVCLATDNANILINYDPPQAGVLSIKNSGDINYHLEGSHCSRRNLKFNTKNKVVDCSPLTVVFIRTGRFFEPEIKKYDGKIHGSIIADFCYKWINLLAKRPLYGNTASKNEMTPESVYLFILNCLEATPKSFVEDYPSFGLSNTSIQGLKKFYSMDFLFDLIEEQYNLFDTMFVKNTN